MSEPYRRLAAACIALVLAVAALGVAPGRTAAADLSPAEAEREMLRLINEVRASHGLVPVRLDSRLTAIARQRSADMANKGYFGHSQPDGRNVFDLIMASRMTWYGAGEILAWNTWPTLQSSAVAARDGWLGSPSHRGIVLTTGYNYAGIGLAVDGSGKKLWTGVFIKGPDRTAAWLKFKPLPNAVRASTGTYRTIRISWSGGDVPLVVLTAGLRNYQTQVRTNGGPWRWVSRWTTTPYRSIRISSGQVRDLRVRACDRAGNCSAWGVQRVRG